MFGLALKEDEGTLCTTENIDDHRLKINYEMYTESSYSEVVLTSVAFSRKDCFDIKCVSKPHLQDIEVEEFDPWEHGFTVVHISKGQKCFLNVHDVEPPDVPSSPSPGKVLPQAIDHVKETKSDRLIIYPPLEVWGYDADSLIVGVVASCHMAIRALYVWYRNGLPYKQGNKLSCRAIIEAGVYTVEVQHVEERDISEPVYMRTFSDNKKISSAYTKDGEESGASSPSKNESSLPVAEREEISFSTKDEIGRGASGVVFKGEWAAPEVAVKKINLRHASP